MRLSKKFVAIAIVATTALAGTAAFAFWSADGTGTGTGTVAHSNGSVTFSGSVDDGLYPGSSELVTFTVSNAGDQAVAAGTIHLDGVTSDDADCDTNAFTMEDVDASAESVDAASGTPSVPGTLELVAQGTLEMANTLVNQDDCKDAVLTLALSSIAQQ